MAQETSNEATALTDIHVISDNTNNINDTILKINSNLEDINLHIANMDQFLVIDKIKADKKEDEQNTEKITEENTKKDNSEDASRSETTEITLEDVYQEMLITNQHLEAQTTLLTVSNFTLGIIVGAILISMFWQRFFK